MRPVFNVALELSKIIQYCRIYPHKNNFIIYYSCKNSMDFSKNIDD